MTDAVAQITHSEFRELRNDVGDMKGLMAKMTDALGLIIRLEERQATFVVVTDKILQRIERMEDKQHEAELSLIGSRHLVERVTEMDSAVSILMLEREKDKTRLQTLLWTVRGLWVVGGSSIALLLAKIATIATTVVHAIP